MVRNTSYFLISQVGGLYFPSVSVTELGLILFHCRNECMFRLRQRYLVDLSLMKLLLIHLPVGFCHIVSDDQKLLINCCLE